MTIATKPRATELLSRMAGGALYRQAYESGMNLSAWLDQEDPESEYNDGLDGFSRLMQVAGIKLRSDPARGYYADEFGAFDKDANTRALVPEWLSRTWRRIAFRPRGERVLTMSDAEALGGTMRPYVDAAAARMDQLAPAVPLSELVAMTTPIDSDSYRAFYLTEPAAADKRMVRVSEGSEFPKVTLTGGDNTIRLFKYGRSLVISYETLRRQRIDKVALWVARVAIQAEIDKVATAIDVMVNGDGNANTAATVDNLSTLDPLAEGELTFKAWLAFRLQFANPYMVGAVLAQSGAALDLLTLSSGGANWPLSLIPGLGGYGSFTPINPGLNGSIRLGITADAPADKLVGVDTRWAIERVTEIGGDIQEVQRWANRQTQELVLSEVEGYATFDQKATRILALAL